ncbi:MAG: hypothetical protein Q7J85_04130 [Bacillota bacterium]|nr:hypothetical protein [Bacillota bacterium]
MVSKRKLEYMAIFCIAIVVILILNHFILSSGEIDIVIFNNTQSEQTICFEPKEQFTFHIPAGGKVKVKYSTDYFSYSLTMDYYDPQGNSKTITISEYVEKNYRGRAVVEMNQNDPSSEIEFVISDGIGL